MEATINHSLRAAVIGLGAMGKQHARVYTDMEEVELVGVADPNVRTLEKVAGRYHTRGLEDYGAMLDHGKPDLVSLAVPTKWHYPIASELIERGIHVLVEEPFTLTLDHRDRDVIHLEGGRRYVVNPGSVGQPRDGNPMASFMIWDDEAREVTHFRCAYDIPAAQARMRDAELPEFLITRLIQGI